MSAAAESNGAAPAAPAAPTQEKRKRFNLSRRIEELGFDPSQVQGLLTPIEYAALPTMVRTVDEALERLQEARRDHDAAWKAIVPLIEKLKPAKKEGM
jgi:hypothetical protein